MSTFLMFLVTVAGVWGSVTVPGLPTGQVYLVNRDRSSRAMSFSLPTTPVPGDRGWRAMKITSSSSVAPPEVENSNEENSTPTATTLGAREYYPSRRERPQQKVDKTKEEVKIPGGPAVAAGLTKPTKYHYYPHNQHIYLLPECAIQQVCNAVYVRLNFTQPLCACPSRYRDPCSASINTDDLHTTELITDPRGKALTLVKTCEPVSEMRECRTPKDWSLLALQNVRTGKSHYLVICRCPLPNFLEGPMSHDQPTYASVPGIRVYGMMCAQPSQRRGRHLRYARAALRRMPFPWTKIQEAARRINWND